MNGKEVRMRLEEFLQSAREGELEIERMADMLLRLDARARRMTAVYRQTGGGKGEGPETIWIQLAQQREKLEQRMAEAGRQQERVEAFISRVGVGRYREMLRLRFLSYLTIEEAAERMGYSYDAGKRLSAQAMRAARTIWEAEHAER